MRRNALVTMAAIVVLIAPAAAVASHSFDDVPDSNVFHADIAWLAASGVTKGCNPPDNTLFCPGDNVTREQMAAFMRRLAGNRVVDAGWLGGLPPEDYARADQAPGVAQTEAGGGFDLDGASGVQVLATVELTAPSSGFVVVTGGGEVRLVHTNGTDTWARMGVSANAAAFGPSQDRAATVADTAPSGTYRIPWSTQYVFPVDEGTHTFYLLGEEVSGDGSVFDRTLNALFVSEAYGMVELVGSEPASRSPGDG